MIVCLAGLIVAVVKTKTIDHPMTHFVTFLWQQCAVRSSYICLQQKSRHKSNKKCRKNARCLPLLQQKIVWSYQTRGQCWVERCRDTLHERGQVISKRQYNGRKAVPEFQSVSDERVKMFINSCIRSL